MKTDAEVIKTQDDLQMVQRPHLWPSQGVFLPLTRPTPNGPDKEEVGCLMMIDGAWVVYKVNMFLLPSVDLETTPKETFATPEELIQAGWVVD